VSVDTYPAIINGQSVVNSRLMDDLDPSTGAPFALVTQCSASDVEAAIDAARVAYEGVWGRLTANERGKALRAIGDAILAHKAELDTLESIDTGKPLKQARTDVDVAARYFHFYSGVVEALSGSTIPSASGVFAFTLREPYGVTGHIIPWNYPLQIGSRTIAPALAAGNCCVLKPAEDAPLTAIRLGQLALDVGIPDGVLNVVPGYGREAGHALATSRRIDHLAFTGSRETGAAVAQAASANVVPVSLELGGKSPNVVFADAPLDEAVATIATSILQNAGQTCSAGSRLLVQRSVYDEVLARLSERLSGVSIGNGLSDPDLGPLISAKQLQRVEGFVNEARASGLTIVGGDRPTRTDLRGGFYYLPTLVDDVPPDARIANEEVFGPVLAITKFDTDEEAIELANATEYGLIAAIWTRDVSRVHRLIRQIRAGQIYVNTYGAGGGVELPFGGFKRSGYGREKGFEALFSYTQVKTCAVRFQ